MRRLNWKTVSTLIAMVVIAGCQENVVSPAPINSAAPAAMMLAPQGHPNLSLNGSAAAHVSVDFTVTPAGGTYFIGRNAVYFPAHSICDPATSSYGVGTWNSSCSPLKKSIRIHAVAHTANGNTAVDFSPSLRFVPSNDPTRWVWLYLSLPGANPTSELSKFNILYSPVPGGAAIDEAKTDPRFRTYVGVGFSFRPIGHFSGFTSSAGFWCEDGAINSDPSCNSN